MLFVLFTMILILVLLILFRNYNKRSKVQENFENSGGLVIGDVSYEDYNVDDMKISEILFGKKIEPKLMNYTKGEEGEGVTEEVTTLSLEAEKVKSTLPEAVKTVGGKEITNLEAIVPILFKIAEKNTKSINDIKVDFEKLRVDFVELKKKK
jgi:hypothetical protein